MHCMYLYLFYVRVYILKHTYIFLEHTYILILKRTYIDTKNLNVYFGYEVVVINKYSSSV